MDMNYFINLTKTYKFTDGRAQINYLHLPVNYVCLNRPFGVYADGISFGNDLVKHLTEFRMPNLVRTPSGGISTSKANLKPLTYAWDIEAKYVDIIVIVNNKGAIFTFGMDTMAPSRELGDDRTPFELYQRCMEIFGQFGIDVWKHKVSKKKDCALRKKKLKVLKKN